MVSIIALEPSNLRAGDRVFAIITPSTVSSFTRSYRPKPYYVLETSVNEVCGEWAGEKRYVLDTEFYLTPGQIAASLDEAKKRLVEIFARETDGSLPIEKVRLVSSGEQKAGEKLVHGAPVVTPPAYAAL